MALSHMHDIAGCRVIFETVDDLRAFRNGIHDSRSQHTLVGRDLDQYNYMLRPKDTGYRGIHDVYAYHVNSLAGQEWNGLMVEIQYRTSLQHAWATAVEVADLTTSSRIKFNEGQGLHRGFFRLASELMARAFEASTSCCPELDNPSLAAEFVKVATESGLWVTLNRLRALPAEPSRRQNAILIYHFDESMDETKRLQVIRYDNTIKAVHEYGRLEKEFENRADVVLVRAGSEDSIREAYRNYYSDVEAFLSYVRRSFPILVDDNMAKSAIDSLAVEQILPHRSFNRN